MKIKLMSLPNIGNAIKMTPTTEFLRRRKTRIMGNVAVFLLCFLAMGYPAIDAQTIVIRGSNTVGEELAPRLIAEYKKDHTGVAFDTEFKATGYGLAELRGGLCDISAASRLPTKLEMQVNKSCGLEMNEYMIGSYSVAVVVNNNNPVSNLTTGQVHDIFTGAIKNWKEVGGTDAPIHLYIRDPISGTHLGFLELALRGDPYASDFKLQVSYAAIVQAVANDPDGIGYCSIDFTTKAGIKAALIDGVACMVSTVNKGIYPYSRVLRFYTNKTKETSAAHDFIEFVRSARGQQIVSQVGYVPHP